MAKKLIYSHASATFNGSNEYISRTGNLFNYQHYTTDLAAQRGITVWCWVKLTSTSANWIFGNWNNAGGDNGWGISTEATTGFLVGELWHDEAGGEGIRVESDVAVNDGEWHLVAMVYDGSDGLSQASNVTLYVDAIPVASTIVTDNLQRVPATGTLTSTAIPNDGDTVTIGTPSVGNGEGAKTYTFQTVLTDVDGNVAIGGSQAQAMENLRRAINLDGVAGTNYATSMTIHPDVEATDTATTVDVTAKLPSPLPSVGNEITTTETSSVMSWGGSTLSGADNRSISTGTIQPYNARKGFHVSPDFFAGQQADCGWMYRAVTQSEMLEIWGDGTPTDPKTYSFVGDLAHHGAWFNGGNGGEVWDGGDDVLFRRRNGLGEIGQWLGLFQSADQGFQTGNGTDVQMEAANNYDNDGPFRGYLNVISLTFDGIDDWVDFGDVHDFERTDTFSIEFWFNTSTAAIQALVAKGDVAATAGYEVSLDASGSIHFFAVNTPSTNELNVRTTATGFDDGVWHHVVVTYDGSSTPGGVHIYVDDVDEALTTVTNNLSASILNADPLRFGARSDGADLYTGDMCQVAFYSRVLTSGEVSELENNGPINKADSTVWPVLIGWWQLGSGDTATTVVDRASTVVGGNDGTTAGSPALSTSVPTGGLNAYNVYCRLFRSEIQYVDCGDVATFQFDNTDAFSMECWFRIGPITTTHFIMGKREASGNSRGYATFMVSNGIIGFQRINTASTNLADIRTVEGFDDAVWHHLVVTTDGTNLASGMTIYVDGVARDVTVTENTLSATILNTVSFQVGTIDGSVNSWDGGTADVAVYDKELSLSEVREHFNAGSPGSLLERGTPGNRHSYSTAANLAAWYPFTGCQQATTTFQAMDHAVNSFNHGTFTGTDVGLGQLFDDGPEGSLSNYSGEASGDTEILSGPTGAGANFATPEPEGMPLPQDQNDGLGFIDTMVRWGVDDQNAPAGQPVPPGGGTGITTFFQMRGVDNGTSNFTTWTVTDNPDPNGSQANAGNTTPTLVGTIVAGSGIVLTVWQQ